MTQIVTTNTITIPAGRPATGVFRFRRTDGGPILEDYSYLRLGKMDPLEALPGDYEVSQQYDNRPSLDWRPFTVPASGTVDLFERLSLGAALPAVKSGEITLASLGDSLTDFAHNIDSTNCVSNEISWVDLACLRAGNRVRYLGDASHAGYTIQQIHDEYLPKVLEAKPTHCLVLAGANDMVNLTDAKVAVLQSIYEKLVAGGVTPILCTNTPAGEGTARRKLHLFVTQYASTHGLPLFDYQAVLVDPLTAGMKSGYSADAVHPNQPVAIQALSDAFATFLTKLFPSAHPPLYLLPSFSADKIVSTENPLFAAPNATSLPNDWYWAESASQGTTATAAGPVGNIWTMTKIDGQRLQANTAGLNLPAGTYDIVFLMEASAAGMQSFHLYDSTRGFALLVESVFTNSFPAGTLFKARFKHLGGDVIPVFQIRATNGAYTGSAGASLSVSQMAFRKVG